MHNTEQRHAVVRRRMATVGEGVFSTLLVVPAGEPGQTVQAICRWDANPTAGTAPSKWALHCRRRAADMAGLATMLRLGSIEVVDEWPAPCTAVIAGIPAIEISPPAAGRGRPSKPDEVLALLGAGGTTVQLAQRMGITRQATHARLKKLLAAGRVVCVGGVWTAAEVCAILRSPAGTGSVLSRCPRPPEVSGGAKGGSLRASPSAAKGHIEGMHPSVGISRFEIDKLQNSDLSFDQPRDPQSESRDAGMRCQLRDLVASDAQICASTPPEGEPA